MQLQDLNLISSPDSTCYSAARVLETKKEWGDFPGGPVVKNHLPMKGTHVESLVQEDPTCHGATKPDRHNYWACAPRARALQQEKPLQWKAHVLQLESSSRTPQLEKGCTQQQKPSIAKNK